MTSLSRKPNPFRNRDRPAPMPKPGWYIPLDALWLLQVVTSVQQGWLAPAAPRLDLLASLGPLVEGQIDPNRG